MHGILKVHHLLATTGVSYTITGVYGVDLSRCYNHPTVSLPLPCEIALVLLIYGYYRTRIH